MFGQPLTAAPASADTSAIEDRYNSDEELRAMLGPATGPEYSVADGRVKNYKWGSLYWSEATGVHEVHGAIRTRYRELGGPAGKLGFPTTDEGRVYMRYDIPSIPSSGARNDFENGAIVWMRSTDKTIWMSKPFADATPYDQYPFWYDLSHDEQAVGLYSRVFDTGGMLMYVTPKGFFKVSAGYHVPDDILQKYRELGAHDGFLRVPTGDKKVIDAGSNGLRPGLSQQFKGGRLYQCGNDWDEMCGREQVEAFEVHGAILWRFDSVGGLNALGYPTSDELATSSGRISYFEKGWISWNASSGKTTVHYY